MNDYTAEGKSNWKTNQDIRAKEMARQLYFEELEVKNYKQKLQKGLE